VRPKDLLIKKQQLAGSARKQTTAACGTRKVSSDKYGDYNGKIINI